MSRTKQLEINLLRARVAAVGADSSLELGDHWEPNGYTKGTSICWRSRTRFRDKHAPPIEREEFDSMIANPCQAVCEPLLRTLTKGRRGCKALWRTPFNPAATGYKWPAPGSEDREVMALSR